jgi:ATP-dependent protease ClpP protease subunit
MNKPIRCFDGNAQPHDPFWTFRNAAQTESKETEIEFYGPISEYSWFGDEISSKLFKEQLYANGKEQPITVRLNSPGGDLIAASVISAMIRDYPARVTVKIDGLAASAAVMVALAGDVVRIQASAYMMVHNPMVGLLGYFNVDELKAMIDELKVIKNGIVEGYMAKTKMDAERLSKLMNDETWMTASEAVAHGFADEVISVSNKATSMVNYANVLTSRYVNVPLALCPSTQPETDPTELKAQRLAAHAKLFLLKE